MGSTTRTCTRCGRQQVAELQMTSSADALLTLLSCRACEDRTWLIDGQPAPVADVLSAAAGNADFVLAPTRRESRKQDAPTPSVPDAPARPRA